MCSISAGFLRQIKLFERLPRVLHLILRKLRKVAAVIGIKSCECVFRVIAGTDFI